MTSSPASPTPLEPYEPLEAFPIPDGAILLPPNLWGEPSEEGERGLRRLALAALRQAMADRQLQLPLGPQIDPEAPRRLLVLNRFLVQLAITGLLCDVVHVPAGPWREASTAPHLVVVAAIDEENGVVHVPGVLTAQELIAAAGASNPDAEQLVLPIEAFRGGIDRLFTLVQLLDPAAIGRVALNPAPARPWPLSVRDWLEGALPPALGDLGAELMPITAAAFRQGGATADFLAPGALAVLSIPLGLTASGELVWGDASRSCIERFQLLLIPTGETPSGTEPTPERLTLRLVGELQGDLLPDGLLLSAVQGSRRLSVSSATSTALELELPASPELIEVTLTPPGGTPLVLPPLQLPAG